MTDGLKPCPFQKEGETHDVRFVELKPGYGQIGCADCGLWFPSDEMLTNAEAFERWNTRNKRTCKAICEQVFAEHVWRCSACGEAFDSIACIYDFCPHCGAEIVQE